MTPPETLNTDIPTPMHGNTQSGPEDAPVRLCEAEIGLTGPKEWYRWVRWRRSWSDWSLRGTRSPDGIHRLCRRCPNRATCLWVSLHIGEYRMHWKFDGDKVSPQPVGNHDHRDRALMGTYGGLSWAQRAILLHNAEGDINRAVELSEASVRLRRIGHT